MKNVVLLGMLALGILGVSPAQAVFIGDISGTATGSGVVSFSTSPVAVDNDFGTPEFTGELEGVFDGSGNPAPDISVQFDFFGDDPDFHYLRFVVDRTSSADDFLVSDVVVTFSDWTYPTPNFVLAGLALEEGDLTGADFTVFDDMLTLSFNNFLVLDESRAVGVRLIFEEDDGGTSNPVPEPATMVALGSLAAGMALARRRRKSA